MIRLFVGFMIVFGATGGIETGDATLLQGMISAAIGLGLAYWPIADGTVNRISEDA